MVAKPKFSQIKKGQHVVQLYRDDAALLKELLPYLNGGDPKTAAILVIATPEHRALLRPTIPPMFLENYHELDAEETLSLFMVGGMPDADLFHRHVGGKIASLMQGGGRDLRAYGEMVSLLWQRNQIVAAVKLEELWNDLMKAYSFSLYCAYSLADLNDESVSMLVHEACKSHTHDYLDSAGKEIRSANPSPSEAELFRLLVESVSDYAIYIVDKDGFVLTWNIGAERIKGYKAEEIIGQHISRFFPKEDRESGKPMTELKHAERFGRYEEEEWRVRKDGNKFWANILISAIRGSDGKLIGFAKVTRDMTERKSAERRLAEKSEMLERFNAMMVNRELEMVKLKKELNALLEKQGLPKKYPQI